MIATVHAFRRRRVPPPDLSRVLRVFLRRSAPRKDAAAPTTEAAVVQALCHDMGGALSSLQTALRQLYDHGAARPELLDLAQSQATHLASMLRTAAATAGALTGWPTGHRPLHEVIAASAAASGLPRSQLTVALEVGASDLTVGDSGLQRILGNLLENAHRHGTGAPVRLTATRRDAWVELVLAQRVAVPTGVVAYLSATTPPRDLTGLGLWSVQRQAHALGGRVIGEHRDGALTIRVLLPDQSPRLPDTPSGRLRCWHRRASVRHR
jgi:K+-sensing histidine kinase KdpD